MGSSISNSMQQNMIKNQETMQKFQIEMMVKQRQLQIASNFAAGKERFTWQSMFYATLLPILWSRGIATKNKALFIPTVPISFVWCYQYDMFYGNKMNRIRKEAERLISEEQELFYMPSGNLIIDQEQYLKIINNKQNK